LTTFERGGYGEVWKCKMGETKVAVKKLLSYWLLTDSSTAVEFARETEILKKLRHPNIVLFLGAGKNPFSISLRLILTPNEIKQEHWKMMCHSL